MKKILIIAFLVFDFTTFAQSAYVDLGLPSGTYWKKENEGGDATIFRWGDYYTYQEAIKKFGNKLPSKKQYEELLKHCKWTLDNHDNGFKVIGPNGNYIILKKVGHSAITGNIVDIELAGSYWTSSSNGTEAWEFNIDCDNYGLYSCPQIYRSAVRLVISKDEAMRIRQIEREQNRIADSIARERKRVADSIAQEKEMRQQELLEKKRKQEQELLEEKRKQEKEIIESLYGEWEGRYVFSKIKLVIDGTNASLYRSGNLIERCPIKISLKGKNLNVEFLNRRRNYYSNELVLYYSIKHNHGWVTTSSSLIYKLQYNAHLNCFQFNCQEGDEYDTTIQLIKSIEKKKKK
ncbi:MAG: DUF4670 domain-containing protein [Bacteroidales bacterium]|nr:DUF4670 domain-containing protein [Bacteroidales bacterium]